MNKIVIKCYQPIGFVISLFLFSCHFALAEPGLSDSEESNLAQLEQALAQGTEYTVVSGDSLSKIAERFYGRSDLWVAILNANPSLRGNPMSLRAGAQIRIPALRNAIGNNQLADEIVEPVGSSDLERFLAEGDAYLETLGVNNAPAAPVAATASRQQAPRRLVQANSEWIYTEGVARAIRREYMAFENAGRIAYLDPNLKEGDRVKKGQVLAYQDQSRPAATVASADAQLVDANSRVTGAQSQLANANAQLVRANTQLAVAQANRMEANANLQLAQRTFQRYAKLLKQNSASQQEYDSANAQLASARAAVVRANEQINSAKADINVAKTGISSAQADVATAKAGVGTARANISSANVTKKESYLISPINGVVARINMEQGYYFTPQFIQSQSEQQLFNTVPIILIDPSRFEITVRLPSDQFDSMRLGAEAYIDIISLNASLEERLPEEAGGPPKALTSYQIRGRIHSISPVLDTDLRNFVVTVRTVRGQQLLRDGENVSLWIRRVPTRQQTTNRR